MKNAGSTSVWMAEAPVPAFPPLSGDTQADVCVIGAGMAGLTTAYLLLREGKSVVVIDAIGVGGGETGRTTAHFFPPDERYAEIAERFGIRNAALVANCYRRATDLVESIIADEHIHCGWERLDGYLVSTSGAWDEVLERELAVTHRLGLDVQRVERTGLPWDFGPCLRFARQAQFHPLRYLAGLAEAITRLGGRIYDGPRATEIRAAGDTHTVHTTQGRIDAADVVVATNTPFNDRVVMHTKQAGYRTYVIGARVPKGALPQFLLWDTGDPYYYVRLTDGGDGQTDVLVVGGQDHKTGQDSHPEHRYDDIEAWTRARFPMAGEIAFRWSGEVMEPSDGLPYLGRNPLDGEHVYVITGDSGNGMTHTTAGAMIVTDLISGSRNSWADLFDPARKAVHGLGDFLGEQANTLGQYADWVRSGDTVPLDAIAPGEGGLVRDGTRLLAVYRHADGQAQALSAACTHLGCAVHWNRAETSWDCPCHGSRFAIDGSVLHGPAHAPLASRPVPGQRGGT